MSLWSQLRTLIWRIVWHQPWASGVRVREPPPDGLRCVAVVPRDEVVHVIGSRRPRFALARKMEVLDLGEVFAHGEPEVDLAVAVEVLRVQGSVHLGQNEDLLTAGELLVQDVHVEILKILLLVFNGAPSYVNTLLDGSTYPR